MMRPFGKAKCISNRLGCNSRVPVNELLKSLLTGSATVSGGADKMSDQLTCPSVSIP
jgi:hypothetical protein